MDLSLTGAIGTPEIVGFKNRFDLTVDLREFAYEEEGVRLEGFAPSFDVVNRATKALQQSPLFREVQLVDAKASLDGARVDFRLNLPFAQEQKP